MSKPHITRTLAPIHFEDLEPHRFEDLVRQLAYDFRVWKSIESTGRGGADDGFDIRAYEIAEVAHREPEDEEQEEVPHPMEGNLWMFQCKREQEIGPRKVAKIVADCVNPGAPPYGYILAAPAHFSKAAHDKFREELGSRGVMEFFLWGAGELEDMLYQPKNDRLLFAFFGISLATRRRSRTADIRASVTVKNKLIGILGAQPRHQRVLLRDLADIGYPYEEKYPDFKIRPRWKEYTTVELHPLGLVVSVREQFAYYDRAKKTWDFTEAVNVARNASNSRSGVDRDEEKQLRVQGFWELLPSRNRAMLVTNGLVRFDAIALVDEKGDSEHEYPHVFVEFHAELGPFAGFFEYLKLTEHHHESVNELSRLPVFPKDFPAQAFGTVHQDQFLTIDGQTRASLRSYRTDITVYDVQQRYTYLKPTDVIAIEGTKDDEGQEMLVKVTNIREIDGSHLLELYEDDPVLKHNVEQQVGRDLKPTDKVLAIECKMIFRWQLEQNRPVV